MIKINIITLFPEMFQGPFDYSIIKRAQEKKLVEIKIHQLRNWAEDKRGTVDNHPFGGGTGMVLMIKPIKKALDDIKKQNNLSNNSKTKVILTDPRGKVFNQSMAKQLSKLEQITFICGHYEAIDERVKENLIDEAISIGDYVLTGGELPVMVIIDAITRLIPGVLKKEDATQFESFSTKLKSQESKKLLEYPQYTQPADFEGYKVPEVLISGDHQKIKKWQEEKSLAITKKNRPDLLK
jgi:tRNA (guanine37-N1)-methyltransferase